MKKSTVRLIKDNLRISRVLIYIFLLLWILITVVTIGWIFISSLKSNMELFSNIWGLPTKLQFSNYAYAWKYGNMQIYFLNTALYLITTLTLLLIIGSMASYVLVRFTKFRWLGLVFVIVISGMALPGQMAAVPLYIMLGNTGLLDTYLSMILIYTAMLIPFTIFVMVGFFRTIPFEIEEAAEIDGASKLRVFTTVVMPMAKPGLITVLILNFISIWNEYFFSLLLISDNNKLPLSTGLYRLRMMSEISMNWVVILAGVVILLIPTMIMFFIFQDKIVKGVTAGAIKG